jgi:hypothetical protein
MSGAMSLPRTPELEAALASASDHHGLQDYYRDCVRPLLGMPMTRWPTCCGGTCEPCAERLKAVARAVYEHLGLDDESAQKLARDAV